MTRVWSWYVYTYIYIYIYIYIKYVYIYIYIYIILYIIYISDGIQQIPHGNPDCHCHSPSHRRAVSTMAFTMKPRGFQSALPRVVTKVPQTTGSFDHFGRFGCVYSDFELFFCTHFRWNWEAFHSFLMFSLQAKEIRVAKCAKGNPVLRPSKWWHFFLGCRMP